MRWRSIGTAVAAGLVSVLPTFCTGAASAQQSRPGTLAYKLDPHLNPEDQLAPSQIVQPIPAAVPEPGEPPIPRRELHERASRRHAGHNARRTTRSATRSERERPAVACRGPFAKNSSMSALAEAFGAQNLKFREEQASGGTVGATVLFPDDPKRRLVVWWHNANRTGTYLIDIEGKSAWTAPRGLRLGLTLTELQKINRKPFKLQGFNQGGIATVSDWNDGALAVLPGGCKASVSLHTKSAAAQRLPAADQYSSALAAIRALQPEVAEILIGY
jgi:hypothetical protein